MPGIYKQEMEDIEKGKRTRNWRKTKKSKWHLERVALHGIKNPVALGLVATSATLWIVEDSDTFLK